MLKFTTELSQAQLEAELRNLGFRTARELYKQYGEGFQLDESNITDKELAVI